MQHLQESVEKVEKQILHFETIYTYPRVESSRTKVAQITKNQIPKTTSQNRDVAQSAEGTPTREELES